MVKVNGALYDSGDTHRLIEIDVIVIEHARVGPLDRLVCLRKKKHAGEGGEVAEEDLASFRL
jgi:hypothetical protein